MGFRQAEISMAITHFLLLIFLSFLVLWHLHCAVQGAGYKMWNNSAFHLRVYCMCLLPFKFIFANSCEQKYNYSTKRGHWQILQGYCVVASKSTACNINMLNTLCKKSLCQHLQCWSLVVHRMTAFSFGFTFFTVKLMQLSFPGFGKEWTNKNSRFLLAQIKGKIINW